jgi:hypothetical protein
MKSIAVNPISTLVATIAIVVQVITANSGFSQDGPVQHSRKALLKAGLFIVPYHQTPELSSLHVELEKPFPRKKFLTLGPRLDYLRPMNDSQGNLFIGYAFKLYPLHWKLQKSFQGPFIGFEPMVLVNTRADRKSRYGPGITPLLGYQQVIEKKYSISFEGGVPYIQDLNHRSPAQNPEGRYFYVFLNFKLGIRL